LFCIHFEPVVVKEVGLVGTVAVPFLVHLIHVRLRIEFGAAYRFQYLRRARYVFLSRCCPQKGFQLFRGELCILFRKAFGLVKLVEILSLTRVDDEIEVFPKSRKERGG
jgi:hypothetical protein